MWWNLYLFYLGFESELKYYLPNVNWQLALVAFGALLILSFIIDKKILKKISVLSGLFATVTSLYLSFILCVTLFGRFPNSSSSWDTLFITYENAYIDVPGARSAIFFNMLLFFPLGLLLSRYKNNQFCVLLLLALPILIELTQLITSLGVFEFSDIINNFIGGMIGLGIVRLIERVIKLISSKRKGGTVEHAE